MPYKSIEKRRAAGREAQRRYRLRHGDREKAYRQTEAHRESRRRYRARNIAKVRAADRAAHRRLRQQRAVLAAVPPGQSAAVDALRAQLKSTRDSATRQRILDALAHLVKVLTGARGVKPRDPDRVSVSRPRIVGEKFNLRTRQNDPDVKAPDDCESSWMDARLGPDLNLESPV